LDRTVIAKGSLMAFSRPLYREGLLTRRLLARAAWAQLRFSRFGASQKAVDRLRLRLLRLTEGWEADRVRSVVASTLAQVIGPITYAEALALIADHKAAGRKVYIVSATPSDIVEPLAKHLGADGAIATQAVVRGGRYTGMLERYAFGPAKAAAIAELAEREALDLSHSWAYSDSVSDVPMLEAVGHPVAVNPERALLRIAQMRGWPVLRFTQPAVVTSGGHRPLRAGLIGAGGAALVAGLTISVVLLVRRRPGVRAAPA
jgi:HAD superfamily hydrolase (TIGR01490 family)